MTNITHPKPMRFACDSHAKRMRLQCVLASSFLHLASKGGSKTRRPVKHPLATANTGGVYGQ
jgi:hypothetical protein